MSNDEEARERINNRDADARERGVESGKNNSADEGPTCKTWPGRPFYFSGRQAACQCQCRCQRAPAASPSKANVSRCQLPASRPASDAPRLRHASLAPGRSAPSSSCARTHLDSPFNCHDTVHKASGIRHTPMPGLCWTAGIYQYRDERGADQDDELGVRIEDAPHPNPTANIRTATISASRCTIFLKTNSWLLVDQEITHPVSNIDTRRRIGEEIGRVFPAQPP